MKIQNQTQILFFMLLVLQGCGDIVSNRLDAGRDSSVVTDSRTDTLPDAQQFDQGVEFDAGPQDDAGNVGSDVGSDAARDAAESSVDVAVDANATDAGTGLTDSGRVDATVVDSGVVDATFADSSLIDSTVVDSTVVDSTFTDTSAQDVSLVDAPTADANMSDSAVPAVPVGALAITEIMANPRNVDDVSGEWFEVVNTTSNAVSLTGCTLAIGNDDPIRTFPLSGTIAANAVVTFGNWPLGSGTGGFEPTFSYHATSGELAIAQGGAPLSIRCGDNVIDFVNTAASMWPDATAGQSFALSMTGWTSNAAAQNDTYTATWCLATTVYAGSGGTSDSGTPGTINPVCQ